LINRLAHENTDRSSHRAAFPRPREARGALIPGWKRLAVGSSYNPRSAGSCRTPRTASRISACCAQWPQPRILFCQRSARMPIVLQSLKAPLHVHTLT